MAADALTALRAKALAPIKIILVKAFIGNFSNRF
jgi:hypothetical protein